MVLGGCTEEPQGTSIYEDWSGMDDTHAQRDQLVIGLASVTPDTGIAETIIVVLTGYGT